MNSHDFDKEISEIAEKMASSPELRDEIRRISENLECDDQSRIEWTQPYVNATPIQEERN